MSKRKTGAKLEGSIQRLCRYSYNLPKSAKAGAKGGGPTPVQCNRQPDHPHTHLPLKSVGQLNLPSGTPLALVQICQ